MPFDKAKFQKSAHEIEQSIAMISSLRTNIENHLPGLQNDLGGLASVSNLLAEEMGQINAVYSRICAIRFQTLLPDSGVDFEKKAEEVKKA
jgi:hypothetical protein